MTLASWITMVVVLALLWGVALWSLRKTLQLEGRKARLIHITGGMDHYNPRALQDLEDWLASHRSDPEARLARQRLEETRSYLQRVPTEKWFYSK